MMIRDKAMILMALIAWVVLAHYWLKDRRARLLRHKEDLAKKQSLNLAKWQAEKRLNFKRRTN